MAAGGLTGAGREDYPLPAFHFKVIFDGFRSSDQAFQEVSGIESELETEDVSEGGENRFVHRLPKAVKHPLLVLKRAVAPLNSPLVQWCQAVLEAGMEEPIKPMRISVYLIDVANQPLRGWSFATAYPVKWEVDTFNSTKNEVSIESVSISYTISKRLL